MQQDLWSELRGLMDELDGAIGDMRATGQALAEAEREYRVKLRKAALSLKMGGMAVGMIQLTVKGVDYVAEAREARDVAEAFNQAAHEVVMATKLKIRIVSTQLGIEYGRPQAGY